MNDTGQMILLEIDDHAGLSNRTTYIQNAISEAEKEIEIIDEDIQSIENLRPKCDKIDYMLAAGTGALCSIIDIFLVGKPNESPLGNITDEWFSNRTKDFAKICHYKPRGEEKLTNVIAWLEKKFKVPYDQTSLGEAAKQVFGVNTNTDDHHFESLSHNPSLLGLFFSILDQFTNQSHFVIEGQLISLVDADNKFKLCGNNVVSKLFCGVWNWIGHLISDISGSNSSSARDTRGMGIPSPIWTWVNDIIVIRRKFGIEESDFDKSINQMALAVFNKGFDMRFQAAQTIPVIVNELIVRMLYSVRRVVQYYKSTPKENRTFDLMWRKCNPYGNATISRMLTVAHGTFCLIDVADATVRGFVSDGCNINPVNFFLRLNLAGVGRFTISLYGEAKREINYYDEQRRTEFLNNKKSIIEEHIEDLNSLKVFYDDEIYLTFDDDMNNHEYVKAFDKTVELAELRKSPEYLKSKSEIDAFFQKKK